MSTIQQEDSLLRSLPSWVPPSATVDSSDYDDILGERRGTSDLWWAAQEWQSTGSFRGSIAVSHQDAVNRVLNSSRVNDAIKHVSEERSISPKQLRKEVIDTLETMGHKLDICAIRKFAFVLPKIMRRIYNKVYVHRPGIERLRRAMQEQPVVLLPTHRSYADFILISYLAYHYNLPFPVIAAGMDFMSMAYIGTLLRQSGAFYIRRSFVEDELYWAVFQEYVQVLVCCEAAPLEFFLEGTRSRTGKSLRPKLGLLSCSCQCCWRNATRDVLFIPINISYSRTLEEELYAYELLGVPKPKESTSGLFKAKNILNENYGNIYFHVGVPVAASSLMLSFRRPLSFSVQNFDINAETDVSPLTKQEMSLVDGLSLHLVREQQRMAVVSSFSIACHFLLFNAAQNRATVPFKLLTEQVSCVVESMQNKSLGDTGYATWGGKFNECNSVADDLRSCLLLHKNIATFDLSSGSVKLVEYSHKPLSDETSSLVKISATCSGVQHLLLQHYANQSIHLFVRPALMIIAIKAQTLQDSGSDPTEDVSVKESCVKERFSELCCLFGHEFIFKKVAIDDDFSESLLRLEASGSIERLDGGVIKLLSSANSFLHTLYSGCLKAFMLTYTVALQVSGTQSWSSESVLVNYIQKIVQEKIAPSGAADGALLYSALSLDATRNVVRTLVKKGALKCLRSVDSTGTSTVRLEPNVESLRDLQILLNGEPSQQSTVFVKARL